MKILTIGISYLVTDKLEALDLISNQVEIINNYVKPSPLIIYCLQSSSKYVYDQIVDDCKSKCPDIYFLYGGEIGVARSRNILIDFCTTKYLWFWDIDCILEKPINDLTSFLSLGNFYVAYIKTPKAYYKDKKSLLNNKYSEFLFDWSGLASKLRFSINAATYNILINRHYIFNNKIAFDERLGLGTYFHQSDEAMFLLTIFKFNLNLIAPYVFRSYTLNQPFGVSLSHACCGEFLHQSLESKGYVVRGIFGSYLGLLLIPFLALLFRWKNPSLSYNTCFYLILIGYCKYTK
jgi:hypothetical protein